MKSIWPIDLGKNFDPGQLIFENWALDVFLNHNLNFPNLMNVYMQRWMAMQRWQPGAVRCWMSGAGSRLTAFQAWRKLVLEGGGAT